MSDPYLGEIRMFAGNFAIENWQECNGQTLNISDNAALFSILGTTYGGNGTTTFQLPNFQGRVPIHAGSGGDGSYVQGQSAGESTHTLLETEMPMHNHTLEASTGQQTTDRPGATAYLARGGIYDDSAGPTLQSMAPSSIGQNGGNQPHNNLQPYLVVTFLIAMAGIFPSRN